MLVIKNATVFSPDPMGQKDILTGAGRILAIRENIGPAEYPDAEVLDAKGLIAVPGIIDNHVHIAGAGGEGGPATRTPEVTLSQLFEGGVTSVVGCLGTDGYTRSVESVLMKAKALRHEGVSAWILTGAYQVPTPTITGDVGRDIALIEEVIGAGEIALSDHRSSCPSTSELIRLATQARVGGMLGKKAGILNIHLGDALKPFEPIHEAVRQSEMRYTQFLPTHCNRNSYIFEDSLIYGREGYIDITTSSYPYYPEEEVKPSKALRLLMEAGVPVSHITFSSDACGSLPGFDDKGNLVKLETGLPSANLREFADSVLREKIPVETALRVITSNVATILKLHGKGFIAEEMDADLMLLNRDMELVHLFAMGRHVVRDGNVVHKGTYEKT